MDGFTWTAELVKALAWPFVVVWIAMLFRKQLRALLNRIRSAKAFGAEAEFESALERAEEIAESAPRDVALEGKKEDGDGQKQDDPFEIMVKISPSAAVLYKWSGIEREMNAIARARGAKHMFDKAASNLLSTMPTNIQILYKDTRALRNKAAHPGIDGEQITAEQAFRFSDVADTLISMLVKYRKEWGIE